MSLLTTQTRKTYIILYGLQTSGTYTFNCVSEQKRQLLSMSQVQVRQVSLATSTDAQRVVGSWVRNIPEKQMKEKKN